MSHQPIIRAAGGVLWRRTVGGIEVGLVHRVRYADWTHPKGKADPGEHPVVTAVREIQEETRVRVRLGPPLPSVRYDVDGRPKRVRYWSARLLDADLFVANEEIDDFVWVPANEAHERLTYPREVEVLDAFLSLNAETSPLVVLRHAKAVRRSDWSRVRDAGPDEARPLRAEGQAQAQALVPLLAAYGPTRLVSSPALRCVDTVDPYAADLGVRVEVDSRLTEEARRADATAAALAAEELLHDPTPALLCTHRPVLPTVLAHVLGGSAETAMPGGPLSPGEFVVLHRSADHVVAVERHTP
jgi:8-oxo-dGTP pyrophosphatase MutT (NUDIX family)/broad specificity phosphatase PhoE